MFKLKLGETLPLVNTKIERDQKSTKSRFHTNTTPIAETP
jgi:hypothetical protein